MLWKVEDIKKINNVSEYVLKYNNSFGSGISQKIVKREELSNEFLVLKTYKENIYEYLEVLI